MTSPSFHKAARAALVDATRLVCVAPPVESLPSVDLALRARTSARVALALNAQNFVHAKTPLFVFYSGVTATSARPRVGSPAGGVEVRVGGTNLNVFGDARDARCRFHRWAPLVPAASLGMAAVAARVADVPPTFKGEDVMVCRTPPFPAGTVAVELSLNGGDFHGTANPPLAHEFACEQRDHLDVASCVADASCGHCADQLPGEGIDHTAYGIVQDRYGCARCHGDGCAKGPAEGACRLWTFETRILEHPATAAEAEASPSPTSAGRLTATRARWRRAASSRPGAILPRAAAARVGAPPRLRANRRRRRPPARREGARDAHLWRPDLVRPPAPRRQRRQRRRRRRPRRRRRQQLRPRQRAQRRPAPPPHPAREDPRHAADDAAAAEAAAACRPLSPPSPPCCRRRRRATSGSSACAATRMSSRTRAT